MHALRWIPGLFILVIESSGRRMRVIPHPNLAAHPAQPRQTLSGGYMASPVKAVSSRHTRAPTSALVVRAAGWRPQESENAKFTRLAKKFEPAAVAARAPTHATRASSLMIEPLAAAFNRAARRENVARKAKFSVEDVVPSEDMKAGRKSIVAVDTSAELILDKGDVASMDAFMKENAETVLIQNVERTEPASANPDALFVYLKPTEIGPYISQIRLTMQVIPGQGSAEVKTLKMEIGEVEKKTGKVDFKASFFETFESTNFITWEDNGSGGLKMINVAKASAVSRLPWWFPLPDSLMSKLSTAAMTKVVGDGIKAVMVQIDKEYTAKLAD